MANTLDGDLSYARPDRGEMVHRVPMNSTGHPAFGPLVLSSWSAGGGGFTLPANAGVSHRGSGFGRLYEAVSGDRTFSAPPPGSFAGVTETGAPVAPRRVARLTIPPADPPEEPADETDPPTQASLAAAVVEGALEDQPLPFVDDQPPPDPEPEQALGPGGEEAAARQPLIALIEAAVVPEPLGLSLLGAGLIGLGWLRRRAKVC